MSQPSDDQAGFELDGEFYPLTFNADNGKDLILIDRITAMPTAEFVEAIRDGVSIGRGPIMLAVLATSIRARRPDWSVERIVRIVQSDLADLKFIGADEEEVLPPSEAAAAAPETAEPTTSPSEGSSPSSTRPDSLSSPTLSVARG